MESTHPGHASTRLSNWAYSGPAYYFLTFCSDNRLSIFGRIIDGEMHLSAIGRIVRDELVKSIALRKELSLDTWLIMPNHIHLIVVLDHHDDGQLGYSRQPRHREAKSISSFVAGFKAAVTSAVRKLGTKVVKVWQRGFFDHIIRTERALFAIRQYILDNPAKWAMDRLNPQQRTNAADDIDRILTQDGQAPLIGD